MAQNNIQDRLLEIKNEIAERCAQDHDFRTALISNPNGTIESEYGLEPGALSQLKIQVVEENDAVVLPIPPDVSEMELTDEQLDQVAGGGFFCVALTVGVIGGVATAGAAAAVVTQQTRAGRSW